MKLTSGHYPDHLDQDWFGKVHFSSFALPGIEPGLPSVMWALKIAPTLLTTGPSMSLNLWNSHVFDSSNNSILFFQQLRWHAKKKTDIFPIIKTGQIAPCTTCVKEKENIICLALQISCSTLMRTSVIGQRT